MFAWGILCFCLVASLRFFGLFVLFVHIKSFPKKNCPNNLIYTTIDGCLFIQEICLNNRWQWWGRCVNSCFKPGRPSAWEYKVLKEQMIIFSQQQNMDNPFETTKSVVENARFAGNLISDDEKYHVNIDSKSNQNGKNSSSVDSSKMFCVWKVTSVKSYCHLFVYLLFGRIYNRPASFKHPPPSISRPYKISKNLIRTQGASLDHYSTENCKIYCSKQKRD